MGRRASRIESVLLLNPAHQTGKGKVMKYKKPARLSDPMSDFSPEELNGILLKQDAELDWRDFDRIFQGRMPAGTYEEVCYYIPLVCACIETQKDACNFFEHFSVWIEDNYGRLKEDGFIKPIVSAFHGLFRKSTSAFVLEENGDHAVWPSACASVEGVLETLFRLAPTCEEFRPDALFAELKENLSFVHAEWIVYISTEMMMLSPERLRSAIPSSDYQKALDEMNENLDAILNDGILYEFWNGRI